VWIQGTGARVDTDEDRNAHDFSESLYGIVGGVDMPVNKDLQLGLAVGYAHNDVDSGFIGKGDTDTWQLIGYGLWTQGQYFANFTLGYGWDNYTTRRQVELAPTTSLHSDTDGHSGFFDLEGGIRNAWNVYVIEPTAGIRGDTLRRDGFTENGEGGLRVKSQSYDALQTRLGAKVNRTVELADGKRVTPEFRAYWLHDFGDSVATESDALLLGQQFTARSPDAGRDALALGLGVTVDAGRDVALFLDYGFTYRDAQTGQGLIGGLSVKW
jgi:outer membrane autotransporter protein